MRPLGIWLAVNPLATGKGLAATGDENSGRSRKFEEEVSPKNDELPLFRLLLKLSFLL
jgi:hypothetical protein